jgi:hypothetical protein
VPAIRCEVDSRPALYAATPTATNPKTRTNKVARAPVLQLPMRHLATDISFRLQTGQEGWDGLLIGTTYAVSLHANPPSRCPAYDTCSKMLTSFP